jgi:hypothetical protein
MLRDVEREGALSSLAAAREWLQPHFFVWRTGRRLLSAQEMTSVGTGKQAVAGGSLPDRSTY